jgi:hypothetical protein
MSSNSRGDSSKNPSLTDRGFFLDPVDNFLLFDQEIRFSLKMNRLPLEDAHRKAFKCSVLYHIHSRSLSLSLFFLFLCRMSTSYVCSGIVACFLFFDCAQTPPTITLVKRLMFSFFPRPFEIWNFDIFSMPTGSNS